MLSAKGCIFEGSKDFSRYYMWGGKLCISEEALSLGLYQLCYLFEVPFALIYSFFETSSYQQTECIKILINKDTGWEITLA